MAQKQCQKCGQTKYLSDFGKRSRAPDGLHQMCKACVNEVARRWRAANPERARDVDKRYRSRHPDAAREQSRRWREEHPARVAEYAVWYRESHPEQLAAYNRSDAHRDCIKRWQKKNRERYGQVQRLWREKNRRRLAAWHRQRRIKAGPKLYSQQDWQALLDQFGRRCLCCGIQEHQTAQKFLVGDHVVPVCLGGSFTIDNIQPLCLDCNRKKHGRVMDYRRSMSVLNICTLERTENGHPDI